MHDRQPDHHRGETGHVEGGQPNSDREQYWIDLARCPVEPTHQLLYPTGMVSRRDRLHSVLLRRGTDSQRQELSRLMPSLRPRTDRIGPTTHRYRVIAVMAHYSLRLIVSNRQPLRQSALYVARGLVGPAPIR
jgi:hypothetical protein